MRFLMIMLCALFCAGYVLANTPAAPIIIELQQPDGTIFEAVPRGNLHLNWMEARSGHTIIKQDDTWYYAFQNLNGDLSPTGVAVGSVQEADLNGVTRHLRPEVDRSAFTEASPRFMNFGDNGLTTNQPVLVLLVSFADIGFVFADSNFQERVFGASDSVADYYNENSYGKFQVVPAGESQGVANDGVVAVTLSRNHQNAGSFANVFQHTVREALAAADPFINYAAYDTNQNGVVSPNELSIILVLAGYENAYGGSATPAPAVWGHKSAISAVTHDAVSLSEYAMFGERHGTSTDSYHQATIGIMCHELGHLMLGLPDLYDRDGSAMGIGIWGLMAGGTWNSYLGEAGNSPSHLCAWSKVKVGFVVPEDAETGQSNPLLTPTSIGPSVKRIWIDKYRSGQHFLIANRERAGYDISLPGGGALIWHIDPEVTTQNDNEARKLVDLEAADGNNDLDTYDPWGGGSDDPFPGSATNRTFANNTNPNSNDNSGTPTGIAVRNIALHSGGPDISVSITPRNINFGAALGHDESGYTGSGRGYGHTEVWTAVAMTNTSTFTSLDGFEVYLRYAATVDFYYYDKITGGNLGTLIHAQAGFQGNSGWNRFTLADAQPFPRSAYRVMVLRISMPGYTRPAAYDHTGPVSGKCWIDEDGQGVFTPADFGDFNQHFLLSSATETPAKPIAVAPLGTISDSTPAFQWTGAAAATWYQIKVDDSTGTVLNKWFSVEEAGCGGGGTCTINPNVVLASGAGSWWVRGWNSDGFGAWSTTADYTLSGTVPGQTDSLSPSGDLSDRTPEYRWNATYGAAWYILHVDDSSGNVIREWFSLQEVGCDDGGVCGVTPDVVLKDGDGSWKVRAWNGSGYGAWSATKKFNVVGTVPGAATLIAPTGRITDSTPTYEWNSVNTATWYLLRVTDNTGITINNWYSAPELDCANGGPCKITPDVVLASGSVSWRVRTWNSDGDGPWSSTKTFTVDDGTPGVPEALSPSGNITDHKPTYRWRAADNATWYLLTVDDSTGQDLIRKWYKAEELGCAGGGTCTVTPETALADGPGSWRVRSWNAVGDGPWSTRLEFNVSAVKTGGPSPAR